MSASHSERNPAPRIFGVNSYKIYLSGRCLVNGKVSLFLRIDMNDIVQYEK